MSFLPTIPETISIGDGTTYLMANDEALGALFGKRLIKQSSPAFIAIVTDALRWEYDSLPSNDTLRGTANYLIWLSGAYGLEARGLTGGGSVIPITPGAGIPDPIRFYVDAGTSPIIAGGSTLSIPTFIGYNVNFFRNGFEQPTIDNGQPYYTWNKTTGIFTCYGVANLDDYFSINVI